MKGEKYVSIKYYIIREREGIERKEERSGEKKEKPTLLVWPACGFVF